MSQSSPPPKPTPPSQPALTPRSSRTIPAGPRTGVDGELERALALRDVMHHAVRAEREITAPHPLRRSRVRVIWTGVLCVALLGLCAYSWVARPELIWGPALPPPSAALENANVRVAMFFLAQRIEAYRQAEGAYPASLEAIGETATGITYVPVTDSSFELRGLAHDAPSAAAAKRPLVLRSTDDADAFLGNSMRLITGRAR